ncbi:hypothetical protein Bpfe_009007, partial [Biomphalaria pfeifferi]
LFETPSSAEPSDAEEELDGMERESKWSSNQKRKDDDDTSRQVSSEEKLLSEEEPKMRSVSVQATPSSRRDSSQQAKVQVAEAATETTPYSRETGQIFEIHGVVLWQDDRTESNFPSPEDIEHVKSSLKELLTPSSSEDEVSVE